jgi:hypothetical protein
VAAVAERLASSPLVDRGGFAVTRMLSDRARGALAREALRMHAAADLWRLDHSTDERCERGDPARLLEMSAGGPALERLYAADPVRRLLRGLTGIAWQPSGPAGSYSYYLRPGHHLGLHRDVDYCGLALITCVLDRGAPPEGASGVLQLWPGRELADVRRDPGPGRVEVRLRPGESVALLGGAVPHAVAPMGAGHVRIVAPLCFKPA